MENHHFRVLVDEGASYWIGFLERNKIPFEAVWKIRSFSTPKLALKTDYSIMRYAWKHGMTILTSDKEMAACCRENNIPCVWVAGSTSLHVAYLRSANRLNKKIWDDVYNNHPEYDTLHINKPVAEKHVLNDLKGIEANYKNYTWVNPTLGY